VGWIRNTTCWNDYEDAVREFAEKFNISFESALSYLKHQKLANKIRKDRIEKNIREADERKNALQILVKNEASEIIRNHAELLPLFQKEINDVKQSAVKGENKSKELSNLFQNFLKLANIEKISSDYWQVFRILSSYK
jgi:hypothetical protein